MTIRNLTPRQIPLQRADQAEAVRDFALSGGIALGSAPTTNVRKFANVELKGQRYSEWCWAACMEMVLGNRRFPSPGQCGLAGSAFSLNTCCGFPFDPDCNRPLPVPQTGKEYAKWGVSSLFFTHPISFEQIVQEISNNRVVLVGLLWSSGGVYRGGHAVLVVGWDENEDGRFLVVYDPRGSGGVASSQWYDDLLNAFGGGSWSFTWTNLEG